MRTLTIALWLAAASAWASPWPASPPAGQTLGGPVLAIAWVDAQRLLAVGPRNAWLWDVVGDRPRETARVSLPEPFIAVRKHAGMILLASESHDAWILTNGMARAVLVGVEETQLVLRATADAVPWPGFPSGIRYREGTDILEGVLPEGSPQHLVGLAPGRADLGVTDRGEWVTLSPEGTRTADGLRVAPTLAWISTDSLLTSSPTLPSQPDALVELRQHDDTWEAGRRVPISGAVRALAAHVGADRVQVACIVEEPAHSTWRLLLLDLPVEDAR